MVSQELGTFTMALLLHTSKYNKPSQQAIVCAMSSKFLCGGERKEEREESWLFPCSSAIAQETKKSSLHEAWDQ
jgi:hypothetical protein